MASMASTDRVPPLWSFSNISPPRHSTLMTYVSRTIASSFVQFDPDQGGDLVGLVLPRAPEVRHYTQVVVDKSRSSDASSKGILLSLTDPYSPQTSSIDPCRADKTPKRRGISRREQSRRNQARYRDRQRSLQLHLQESVNQLRQEIDQLQRGYERLKLDGNPKQSPWVVVVEIFHFIEDIIRAPWCNVDSEGMTTNTIAHKSFMFPKGCFSPDVAMGDRFSVDALIGKLRRYSQNFKNPKLQLQRIESIAPGVVIATSGLCGTVTELTIRNVFPNLSTGKSLDADGDRTALREQLLGQRIACICTMAFFFNEENGRVERLECNINVVDSLLRVRGNLKDVAMALNYSASI